MNITFRNTDRPNIGTIIYSDRYLEPFKDTEPNIAYIPKEAPANNIRGVIMICVSAIIIPDNINVNRKYFPLKPTSYANREVIVRAIMFVIKCDQLTCTNGKVNTLHISPLKKAWPEKARISNALGIIRNTVKDIDIIVTANTNISFFILFLTHPF